MKAAPTPYISIVLPVYNGADHLKRAIDSVLGQTFNDLELLVVDDGSSDNSFEIASGYPQIRLFRQENKGVPHARNKGVAEARGKYVCFLDQDDTWLPEKLELQVKSFKDNPSQVYSTTLQVYFLEEGYNAPSWCKPEWLDRPVTGYTPSTLMIEKDALLAFGMFDEEMTLASDVDLFFRLKDQGAEGSEIRKVLVRKSVHEQNQSRMRDRLREDILRVIKQSIGRKREMQNH